MVCKISMGQTESQPEKYEYRTCCRITCCERPKKPTQETQESQETQETQETKKKRHRVDCFYVDCIYSH
uniref:Uncharacterized protein n=1 Tax=viral metagenome TaxID=1070528 RepID=A0A6C0EQG8_9ZZZZ